MGQYKTPGVYSVEKNAFLSSIGEVATSVPAFIGYTEKANNKGQTLLNKAWRISSMSEFIHFFGGPPESQYKIVEVAETTAENVRESEAATVATVEPDFVSGDKKYLLYLLGARYFLYHSMMLFF